MLRFTHTRLCALSVAVLLGAGQARAGTFTTLHEFDGATEGWQPVTSLNFEKGLLYGTTKLSSGTACKSGCGTAFSIDPATGAETILHVFTPSVRFPGTNLVIESKEAYGTTGYNGTIFRLNIATEKFKVLYKFTQEEGYGSNGLINVGQLLYGTTPYGGAHGVGSLFSFNPATGVETELYSFGASNTDGIVPIGQLTNVNGVLYGTTSGGGQGNTAGTVFEYDPASGNYAIVASLTGSKSSNPLGSLVSDGTYLFGAAEGSQDGNAGSVFRLDPVSGMLKTLYVFGSIPDALVPNAPLVVVGRLLYGTAMAGGASNAGAIYTIDKVTGAENVVYSLNGKSDGKSPLAGLVFQSGSFYGTAAYGGLREDACSVNGPGTCGTVFKFTP